VQSNVIDGSVRQPREVFAYLKDMATCHPKRYIGHNPAGGVIKREGSVTQRNYFHLSSTF